MDKLKLQILGLLAMSPNGLSASELRAQVSPKVSQPTLWRRIDELRAVGQVQRIGRGRTTRYLAAVSNHSITDLRSKALHIEVGKKLIRTPQLLEQARRRLEEMRITAPYAKSYLERWTELLSEPLNDLLRVLGSDDEEAKALRHTSPFAGFLSQSERLATLRRQGLIS